MTASPENPLLSPTESLKSTTQFRQPIWLDLHREQLNHLSSMVVGAALSEVTTDFLFKLNHQVLSLFMPTDSLIILDKFHSTNLVMALAGGVILGDIVYRGLRKTNSS
jgi:uncharacterized protein YaaW (UPF0174 family)